MIVAVFVLQVVAMSLLYQKYRQLPQVQPPEYIDPPPASAGVYTPPQDPWSIEIPWMKVENWTYPETEEDWNWPEINHWPIIQEINETLGIRLQNWRNNTGGAYHGDIWSYYDPRYVDDEYLHLVVDLPGEVHWRNAYLDDVDDDYWYVRVEITEELKQAITDLLFEIRDRQ